MSTQIDTHMRRSRCWGKFNYKVLSKLELPLQLHTQRFFAGQHTQLCKRGVLGRTWLRDLPTRVKGGCTFTPFHAHKFWLTACTDLQLPARDAHLLPASFWIFGSALFHESSLRWHPPKREPRRWNGAVNSAQQQVPLTILRKISFWLFIRWENSTPVLVFSCSIQTSFTFPFSNQVALDFSP